MTIEWLATYQPLLVPVMLGLTVLLETARPLAQMDSRRWRHTRRNIVMGALAFVTFGALGGVKAGTSAWVGVHHFGVLNVVALPSAVRILVSFLAIDLVNYIGHRLQHGVPWLWRFHRVHHSDPQFDATSSLRFHPFEAVVEVSYQSVAVLVFGIDLDAVVLFDTILLAILYVQHANVDWSERLDRLARLVFVHAGRASCPPLARASIHGLELCRSVHPVGSPARHVSRSARSRRDRVRSVRVR
jgi:sterol desaturase/sphingolipid hydroxylase (fatty acid hydroxylase superfamily)